MSGLDEQIISDFPECPKCHEKGKQYLCWHGLNKSGDCIVFFNPNSYVGWTKHPKVCVSIVEKSVEMLDDVYSIHCTSCDYVVDDETKDVIIEFAKICFGVRGSYFI